jgi:chaperonin GroES
MTPLHDYVLLRPCEAQETTTKGGIVLPGSVSQDKFLRADVIAVGLGRRTLDGTLVPVSVPLRATVVAMLEACREVMVSGDRHYLVREDAVVAYTAAGYEDGEVIPAQAR